MYYRTKLFSVFNLEIIFNEISKFREDSGSFVWIHSRPKLTNWLFIKSIHFKDLVVELILTIHFLPKSSWTFVKNNIYCRTIHFVFRYYDKVEMNLVRGGSREHLIDHHHHHHLYSNRLHRSVGSGLEQQIKSPSSSDSSRKKNTKVLVISAGPQAEQVI